MATTTNDAGQTREGMFITEKMLARELFCSQATLYRNRRNKVIPRHTYFTIGKTILYKREYLAEVIDAFACEGVA